MFKRFFGAGGADSISSCKTETADDEIKFGGIEWIDTDTFKTPNFLFNCSSTKFDGKTTTESVAFLKSKNFLSLYDTILQPEAEYVFELGLFQGGMPLMLADTTPVKKVVSIDYHHPSDAIMGHVNRAGLENRVKLHGGIDQGDSKALREILDNEFRGKALDLITDDCSHEYEQTKASFEATFGYLKPGGKFVIEDWGWAHWPGEPWQSEKSYFHGRPAMTNVLFEILMAHASAPGIISKVEMLNPAFAVVTRGPDLPHGFPLNLSATYKTAGRVFTLL